MSKYLLVTLRTTQKAYWKIVFLVKYEKFQKKMKSELKGVTASCVNLVGEAERLQMLTTESWRFA